ncbi:MAG TPA: hypothetical protein VJT08_00350 [Terriglobales bacterium]|nr:hypothetical protein [Terriglobales bacterium]
MRRRAAPTPYLKRSRTDKALLTFLRNHCEAIAAMDSFAVRMISFGLLYRFFVIGHSAFQCHKASEQHVDRAAASAGLPV